MSSYAIFYAFVAAAGLLWMLVFRYGFDLLVLRGLLGVLLCAVAAWTWHISEPAVLFSDFNVAYYPAGRAILNDLPHLFTRCWDTPVCGFVNLPAVAYLFTPFSMLTLRHAQWLFVALSLTSLALSLSLLWSVTDRAWSRRWAMMLLFVMNGPLYYSLKEGNLTHFALLLLIAGVVCLDKTWDRRAGICFALAAVIKLPLLLFGVYFFGKRHWKVVEGYVATVIAVGASSLWYAGWSSHAEWYREVILPFSNRGLAAFNVQSLEGFMLRLQDGVLLYDWKPVEVPGSTKLAERVMAALLMGVSGVLCLRAPGRHRRETTFLELSMVLCLSLIISPISWSHYFLLLLLPCCLYVGNRLPLVPHNGWRIGMVLGTLLITPPVTFMGQNAGRQAKVANLMVSHYVIGALLLWAMLGYARWSLPESHRLRLVRPAPAIHSPLREEGRPESGESDSPADRQAAG